MNNDKESKEAVSRRKILTLAGVTAIALSSSTYGASIRPEDTQVPPESGRDSTETQTTVQEGAIGDEKNQPTGSENIDDFGAIAGEDTQAVARKNTEAIRKASHETGQGGTVYVPAGEYFFGRSDDGFIFQFGSEEPAGISFLGDGPRQSKLVLSSTIDSSGSHRGFTYNGQTDNVDHGDVVFRDICFNGNYENLDMASGVTVWGFNVFGDGHFLFENVCIRGWWANGTRFTGPSVTIRRSTFRENAIGVTQNADSITAGHHIVARPPADSSMMIEDSEFYRCSGNVINRRENDGDVTLRRVWIQGAGIGVMKLSETDGTTRIENTYARAETDWIAQNLPSDFDMRGRWFVHRVRGSEYTPTLILDNVVAREFTREFLLCYQDTDLIWKGDAIAIHNTTISDSREAAIRGDSGIVFDIGTVSIHDTNGRKIFQAPESSGNIEKLRRDRKVNIGEIGNLSVGDLPGTEPIEPTVARPWSVGIGSAPYRGEV